jgi:hypothetical protein
LDIALDFGPLAYRGENDFFGHIRMVAKSAAPLYIGLGEFAT